MKCAILLSGQFRNHSDCSDNIMNNLIIPNNADIFILSESESDSKSENSSKFITDYCHKQYHQYLKSIKIIEPLLFLKKYGNQMVCNEFHKLYCELFGPIKMKINHFSPREQYYKLYLCHRLMKTYEKKEGIKYDFIIRCRMDITMQKPFIIRDLAHTNKLNLFCMYGYQSDPILNRDQNAKWLSYGLMDYFFCGNRKTMSKVCEFIQYLYTYYLVLPKKYYSYLEKYANVESFLLYHLLYHHIQIKNLTNLSVSFQKKGKEVVQRTSFDDQIDLNIFTNHIRMNKKNILNINDI